MVVVNLNKAEYLKFSIQVELGCGVVATRSQLIPALSQPSQTTGSSVSPLVRPLFSSQRRMLQTCSKLGFLYRISRPLHRPPCSAARPIFYRPPYLSLTSDLKNSLGLDKANEQSKTHRPLQKQSSSRKEQPSAVNPQSMSKLSARLASEVDDMSAQPVTEKKTRLDSSEPSSSTSAPTAQIRSDLLEDSPPELIVAAKEFTAEPTTSTATLASVATSKKKTKRASAKRRKFQLQEPESGSSEDVVLREVRALLGVEAAERAQEEGWELKSPFEFLEEVEVEVSAMSSAGEFLIQFILLLSFALDLFFVCAPSARF